MRTYLSTDDGVSFSDTAAAPAQSGSLGTSSPNNRVYYKTEIINGSTTPQNVSLYIKDFATGGQAGSNICVGTNVPVKSFKNYSKYGVTIPAPTKNKTNGNTKRVYFEPVGRVPSGNKYDNHRTTWSNKTYYVCSGGSSTDIDANNGSAGTYTQMTVTANYSGIYYADIPWDHNKLYFTVNDWGGTNYKRTQTFTNLSGDGLSMTQSLLFYTNGTYTDYNNAWAGKENCVGANFAGYYKDISITSASGESISVGLASSDYQSNSAVSYSSNNTAAFTVSSSGVITPVANLANNVSAKLTYTATSVYGDTKNIEVNVTVKALSNSTQVTKSAPIVTNLLIPAATTENTVNSDSSNVQDVYWFIQNGDEMYGQASASGTYTLDSIYLGL